MYRGTHMRPMKKCGLQTSWIETLQRVPERWRLKRSRRRSESVLFGQIGSISTIRLNWARHSRNEATCSHHLHTSPAPLCPLQPSSLTSADALWYPTTYLQLRKNYRTTFWRRGERTLVCGRIMYVSDWMLILSASGNRTLAGIFQLHVLEKEALEVLSLIRFKRNRLLPINRLPPDVLVLIPDYWSSRKRAKNLIALTHVCQTWREIFISRASLWTDFYCVDGEKTRVYLDRSGSAPINVQLERKLGLSPNDPFLQIAPHAISRLRHLYVRTTPDHFQNIIQHLFHPAPLLKVLTIDATFIDRSRCAALPTDLFHGDLSSLRELRLDSVQTELPWRNMNNLTSFSCALPFSLGFTISVGQILDFLENSPRLVRVGLSFAAPSPGVQGERLVGLAHLRTLFISGSQPPCLLLNHLIVPVGANVSTKFDSPGPFIEDHLLRSLDNLRNFSHFTEIRLCYNPLHVSTQFTGPNGQVCIASSSPRSDAEKTVPRSLAKLDISKTRRLEIVEGSLTIELHEALVSMKNLRTLVISRCNDTPGFLLGLHFISSLKCSVICPKLEELVLRPSDFFDKTYTVEIATNGASEGGPLKLVKVVSFGEPVPMQEVARLLERVPHAF
jgi:hypothetical protein